MKSTNNVDNRCPDQSDARTGDVTDITSRARLQRENKLAASLTAHGDSNKYGDRATHLYRGEGLM